jgi:mannan endo-1,4-beta-mannosidase
MMLTALLCLVLGGARPQSSIRLEAETADQFDTVISHDRPGFSGSGYVTGFTKENSHIIWKFRARPGIYLLKLYYSSTQAKGTSLKVNGVSMDAMLDPTGDKFGEEDLGKVDLKEGENVIQLDKGWGYYDVDYAELVPAQPDPPPNPPMANLSDPLATSEAKRLYRFLLSQYGNHTLSGQYGNEDNARIVKVTGAKSAIFGTDLMDYSPSRVEHGAQGKASEEAIEAVRGGQIITLSWHWNAPTDLIDKIDHDAQGHEQNHLWYRGFYTDSTNFDFSKALADPGSPNYRLMLRDIDTIAVQLKKLSDARIPVLWRPLHEAEGGWFWWGARGPDSYKALWKLLYERLTNYHHLHNLIWVYSSGIKPEWYPGDAFVDVVGIDAYPGSQDDSLSPTWELLSKRFAGRKLLAISEFGGVPNVERMRKFGIDWSFFVSWSGFLKNFSDERLKQVYLSPAVVNGGTPVRY